MFMNLCIYALDWFQAILYTSVTPAKVNDEIP